MSDKQFVWRTMYYILKQRNGIDGVIPKDGENTIDRECAQRVSLKENTKQEKICV